MHKCDLLQAAERGALHTSSLMDTVIQHWCWTLHTVRGVRRDVLGLDATAAQTLGSLWGSLRGANVELVLTGVRRASMLRLMQVRATKQELGISLAQLQGRLPACRG